MLNPSPEVNISAEPAILAAAKDYITSTDQAAPHAFVDERRDALRRDLRRAVMGILAAFDRFYKEE